MNWLWDELVQLGPSGDPEIVEISCFHLMVMIIWITTDWIYFEQGLHLFGDSSEMIWILASLSQLRRFGDPEIGEISCFLPLFGKQKTQCSSNDYTYDVNLQNLFKFGPSWSKV